MASSFRPFTSLSGLPGVISSLYAAILIVFCVLSRTRVSSLRNGSLLLQAASRKPIGCWTQTVSVPSSVSTSMRWHSGPKVVSW
eukprot:2574405-Pyramimonas_sp.AAC.1